MDLRRGKTQEGVGETRGEEGDKEEEDQLLSVWFDQITSCLTTGHTWPLNTPLDSATPPGSVLP